MARYLNSEKGNGFSVEVLPQAKTIPIVAMTANAFAEDVKAAKDAGMNGHIAKPGDINTLYSTLAEVMKSETLILGRR